MIKCGVCDKELTSDERITIDARDYLITCDEHRQYRLYCQPWLAKMESGISFEKPKKCVFCKSYLTPYEVNDIHYSHQNVTCKSHADGRQINQLELYIFPEIREEFVNRLADSKYDGGEGQLQISIMRIATEIAKNPDVVISFEDIINAGSRMFNKEQLIKLFSNCYLFNCVGFVSDEGSDEPHSVIYITKNVNAKIK
jgi:hypothetical protein